MNKNYFRCTICNDVHFGVFGPLVCPTCSEENAYCEIDKNEFQNISSDVINKENIFSEEDMKKIWEEYSSKNDFKLNSSTADMIAKGVLANELKSGLKLCPCRLSDGSREKDLELICPCDFKKHDTWEKDGRCWCNLFVKG